MFRNISLPHFVHLNESLAPNVRPMCADRLPSLAVRPVVLHTPMFDARLHTGLSSVADLWRRLEAEGRCAPCQSFAWTVSVVRHLATSRDHVFVVELRDRAGDALLLMPLVARRAFGVTTIERLSFEVCDYAAPVLADAVWSRERSIAAWAAIRAILPAADAIYIDGMPLDVAGAINPIALWPSVRQSRHTTCGLPLSGTAETVLVLSCQSSFVRKLGKTGRRLARSGEVRFVEARTEADIDTLFLVLLEQRRSRFRKLGRADLLDRPAVAAFYRDAAFEGLRDGGVRLLGLQVGDAWVGTYYGLLHGATFQGLIVTIDDAWRTCSPGLHVHAHVMQWARGRGVGFFDMSIGSASYKDDIGGSRGRLVTLDEALTWRGRLFLAVAAGRAAGGMWLDAHPTWKQRGRRLRRHLRRAAI